MIFLVLVVFFVLFLFLIRNNIYEEFRVVSGGRSANTKKPSMKTITPTIVTQKNKIANKKTINNTNIKPTNQQRQNVRYSNTKLKKSSSSNKNMYGQNLKKTPFSSVKKEINNRKK